MSFAEAIRDLPQAVETTVAYQNPYTDGWVETERFNALIEPTRTRKQAADVQVGESIQYLLPLGSGDLQPGDL